MINEDLELSNIEKNIVIIPAAGLGQRFGSETPKQYLKINGTMILDATLNIFLHSDLFEKIILIISPEDQLYKTLDNISNEKLIVIDGGQERQNSVNNGLRYLYDNGLPDDTPVLVHDAVRPCVAISDINLLLEEFELTKQACFLAERITDSLKKIDLDNNVIESVPRDDLIHALTPQMAKFIDLKYAISSIIKNDIHVTDEVTALIDYDLPVKAVIANHPNPKITIEKDLVLAENLILKNS